MTATAAAAAALLVSSTVAADTAVSVVDGAAASRHAMCDVACDELLVAAAMTAMMAPRPLPLPSALRRTSSRQAGMRWLLRCNALLQLLPRSGLTPVRVTTHLPACCRPGHLRRACCRDKAAGQRLVGPAAARGLRTQRRACRAAP